MKNLIQKLQTILSVIVLFFAFTMTSMSFSTAPNENCPDASFVANNNGCMVGCTIYFENQSIDATSYSWSFGDGNTSTEENPSHNYSDAGTYTVTLRASDGICEVSYIGIVEIVQT